MVKHCKKCGKTVGKDDEFCEHCGAELSKAKKKEVKTEKRITGWGLTTKVVVGVIAVIIVGILVIAIGPSFLSGTTEPVCREVQVSYTEQESYEVQEPYEDTENCRVRDVEKSNAGYIWIDDTTIKVYADITNNENERLQIEYVAGVYLSPAQENPSIYRESTVSTTWFNSGETKKMEVLVYDVLYDNFYVYSEPNVLAPSGGFPNPAYKCDIVTKYRTVTKYRDVTKYRNETVCD